MKSKLDETPPKSKSWRISASMQPLKWILWGPIFALLLLTHSFAAEWWEVSPPGQPEQMSSEVHYNPKLFDKFFESDDWICPRGAEPETCRDGKPITILNDPWDPLKPETCFELRAWTCADGCKECAICRYGKPVVKLTARCYATSWGVKHPVKFCEAKSLDGNVIELLIHESNPAFRDALRILIREGKFTSQYWVVDAMRSFTWTTTRQKLTLDKKMYRKGDLIKGRIDFECVSKVINPKDIERWGKDPSSTCKVYGVFKATLE
jgi:hypothetical protein